MHGIDLGRVNLVTFKSVEQRSRPGPATQERIEHASTEGWCESGPATQEFLGYFVLSPQGQCIESGQLKFGLVVGGQKFAESLRLLGTLFWRASRDFNAVDTRCEWRRLVLRDAQTFVD